MNSSRLGFAWTAAALALLAMAPLAAVSMTPHNVPDGVAIGHYEGRVDSAKEMNLTITLKMHNEADFDRAYEEVYDPASSRYQKGLEDAELDRFAPTAAEFSTVKSALEKQGFTVISEDPRRFSIRVRGTAAAIEKAFHTELGLFSYNGRTFQAHLRDAYLDGPAGELISGISGLERHDARPQLSILRNPRTGEPIVKKRLGTHEEQIAFINSFTATPLSKSATLKLTTPGASLPKATYTGYEYGANGSVGGLAPADLEAHYGVPFTQGTGSSAVTYDGTGQTIALVEAYGYATPEADANAAASYFGLPAFTSKTFSVVYPDGNPLNANAGFLSGWDVEIALDIQSAHAMAPKAKIVVVASPGQDNEDMLNALSYVISHKIANAVSDSWEEDSEVLAGPLEEAAYKDVLKLAAAAKISFQFSSGDGGDDGYGTPVGTQEIPSNSTYVTAVGGTSVLNNPYGSGQIVTGWGTNEVQIDYFGVQDPLIGYFFGGAGGGQSQLYAKPAFQSTLSGSWRLTPDVSAVADPYTGFPLVITQEGQQYGMVVGGTSLASPVFTAIWAVADQYNGTPLGQAAQYLQKLSSTEISDVAPPSTTLDKYDVTGSITDSKGTHAYNAKTIFTDAGNEDASSGNLSLYSQQAFLSADWDTPGNDNEIYLVVSFGTDSSLTVTKGWDNVTGWGEPNGEPFIKGVTGKTTGAAKPKE
jgi:subtilase family serine protease